MLLAKHSLFLFFLGGFFFVNFFHKQLSSTNLPKKNIDLLHYPLHYPSKGTCAPSLNFVLVYDYSYPASPEMRKRSEIDR